MLNLNLGKGKKDLALKKIYIITLILIITNIRTRTWIVLIIH